MIPNTGRCEDCGGHGEHDTGGVHPWGQWITAPCETCKGSGFAKDREPCTQYVYNHHHARCIEALQRIALLADSGSNEHKIRYARCYEKGIQPAGWRVVEDMREIANDVAGILPLSPIFDEPKKVNK